MGPLDSVTKKKTGTTISFQSVSKRFWKGDDPFDALTTTNLEVGQGEFLGLIGPSGCGKSTLLHLAAGLLSPTQGDVLYDGEAVTKVNTKVGYLTQKDTVLPWRTVLKNVMLPLEVRNWPRRERRDRAQEFIDLVGLSGFENHYPAELSGGMRKRVALAAVLVYGPQTILMDEPFGALDAQLRLVLQQQLLEIWEETKKTILFVTHDLTEAVALCDRVVVMSPRPGRISEIREIPIPRPRDLNSVRVDPAFVEIYNDLWSSLSRDMLQGEEIQLEQRRSERGTKR